MPQGTPGGRKFLCALFSICNLWDAFVFEELPCAQRSGVHEAFARGAPGWTKPMRVPNSSCNLEGALVSRKRGPRAIAHAPLSPTYD